jgi:hypothetical protein
MCERFWTLPDPPPLPARCGWRPIRCRRLRARRTLEARTPCPSAPEAASTIGGRARETKKTERSQLSRLVLNDFLQADRGHSCDFRQGRPTQPMSREIIYAEFGRADSVDADLDRASLGTTNGTQALPSSGRVCVDPAIDLARCFLRLANLPSYPLDRLSRYEAVLWRQAGQTLFALDALDRRKPQDRRRRFRDWERNEA